MAQATKTLVWFSLLSYRLRLSVLHTVVSCDKNVTCFVVGVRSRNSQVKTPFLHLHHCWIGLCNVSSQATCVTGVQLAPKDTLQLCIHLWLLTASVFSMSRHPCCLWQKNLHVCSHEKINFLSNDCLSLTFLLCCLLSQCQERPFKKLVTCFWQRRYTAVWGWISGFMRMRSGYVNFVRNPQNKTVDRKSFYVMEGRDIAQGNNF